MEYFFKVKKPEEVLKLIEQFEPLGIETVPLQESFGRVLGQTVIAREDLPHFFRSVVDGYAVRSRDTFGASETLPALLEIAGEVLMGQDSPSVVEIGQAIKISTGGMLPANADSVVMVEYCHLLDDKTLEVGRAVSPLENTIQPGDDFREGQTVLPKGHVLRPQDVGVLAALGQTEPAVFAKPKVAIISTGDEIVEIDQQPRPGQVRDINRYTLDAFCRREGAEPVHMGLVSDDFEILKERVHAAVGRADSVWISGGSSVGARDMTLKVFETLPAFELLAHGISISPGKPTIIGRCGSKSLIGLPGHVASALVIAEVFLAPLVAGLSGRRTPQGGFPQPTRIEAILARNVESAAGREDYIRVKLKTEGGAWVAEPIFGKSGLISTLVEADGLIRVDMNTEGLYKGETVQVMLRGGFL
jgi:molybdopterin molybdotransferase